MNKTIVENKNWFMRHKIWTGIIAFVVLVFLVSCNTEIETKELEAIPEIEEIIELEEEIEQKIIVKEDNEVVEEPQSKQKVTIDCNFDKYNCGDFNTHSEAQVVFEACGNDVHRLDRDKDGIACESLK